MNTRLTIISAATGLTLLIGAGPVLAQDTDDLIVEQQEQQELRANNLIGMTVQNPEGEEIGSISDLVIDNEGRTTAAVLSVGGFLGIGAKQVGVHWDKLEFDTVQLLARVDASIDRGWLEQAPDFLTWEQIEAERQRQQAIRQQEQQQMQQEQQMQQQQAPANQ